MFPTWLSGGYVGLFAEVLYHVRVSYLVLTYLSVGEEEKLVSLLMVMTMMLMMP